MKIIYKNGIINVDKIMEDTGVLLLEIADYSKVSRLLYPEVNNLNQYRLMITLSKKQNYDICLHETSSKENAEKMKALIINSYSENKDIDLTTVDLS